MKKKVLIVVQNLCHGGIQHSLVNFCEAIDYSKYDVDVLLMQSKIDIVDLMPKQANIIFDKKPLDYTNGFKNKIFGLQEILLKKTKMKSASEYFAQKYNNAYMRNMFEHNYKKIRDNRYDVAIAYFYSFVGEFVSDYVLAKKKVIFYHSSIDEKPELHKKILPNFDKIITGSPAMAEVIYEAHPSQKEKVSVLPYYIDAEETRKKASETFDFAFDKSKAIITSCGRLSQEKGYDIAAKAAVILKKSGVPFRWYHIGDGPERGKIETVLRDENAIDSFVILGMKSNPFPYISNSDIFVQPSRFDGNPLSVVEAKILNIPVVATKTLGGKYLVKDGESGLQCEINPEDLAEKIKQLIDDDGYRYKIKEQLSAVDYSNAYENYKRIANDILE